MRLSILMFIAAIPFFLQPAARAASDVVMGGLTSGRENGVCLALLQENVIATFRLKDANSDGRLTLDELLRNSQEVFLEMENKTPGVLNLEDVLSYRCGKPELARGKTSPASDANREGFYARMDANGDGVVEPAECRLAWTAEFKAMNLSRDGRLTLEQYLAATRRWFERMDANHDSVVTLDEFMADQMGCQP